MTQYREILHLKSLGFSEWNIAHSCGMSRNTVLCWLNPRLFNLSISRYLVIVTTSFECIYTKWCTITF